MIVLHTTLGELTDDGPPLAPKRLIPLIARNAASAMPIEDELSSG